MSATHFGQSFPSSVPENYERFFVPAIGSPVAHDLLTHVELQAGDRVLDVGCGTGVVTRLAAERVGPSGSVVGLDVNPAMLEVAASATPTEAAIEWRAASAEAIPFADGSFDAVLCGLSLQFVKDREEALCEMSRVLVPGGRLALNVPGPIDPIFGALSDALGEHIAPEAGHFVRAVFSLHDESEIERLLGDAGFRDVAVDAYTRDLSLPAGTAFLWQYVNSTPLARFVANADDRTRTALEQDVLAEWSNHEGAGALEYQQRIVVATGTR
jgi:ubiquinone/menaquinone biosynthesis C-methylase UbiE